MLKRLYVKAQSIWKPRKEPLVMSHSNKNVISAKYLDPKKVTKMLNEMVGETGWSKMEASIEMTSNPRLHDVRANLHDSTSTKQL